MNLKNIIRMAIISIIAFGLFDGQSVQADSVYTIKAGDTLWDIANEYDITVDDLMNWNELTSSLIFPDQELKVYEGKDVYIVKKGDTLFEIAASYDITLEDLMELNDISSHLIYPGEQLTITENKETVTIAKLTNGWTKSAIPSPSEIEKEIKIAENKTPVNHQIPPKKKEKPISQNHQVPTAAPGKEMTVTATAYTAYCTGCSGTTYTGIDLRANPNQKVIAVDPNVIPLGSRVWVEGYGEAIAGDIGGAIKGNIIDVFLEHKQDALNWGRKTVKIKILE